MKLCLYKDCLNDFIALTGLESEPDDFVKTRFNSWFNLRLREIWRAARWSELLCATPLIVCYGGWIELPSDAENGDLFELFDADFRVNKLARRVSFLREGEGAIISNQLQLSKLTTPAFKATTSYQQKDAYKKDGAYFYVSSIGNIALTGVIYAKNFLYSNIIGKPDLKVGDIIVSADSNAFCASVCVSVSPMKFEEFSTEMILKTAVIRYKRINPDYSKDDTERTLPYRFKNYIAEATRANWLAAENRAEEAQNAEKRAQIILDEEIFRLEQNSYSQIPVEGF